MISFAGVRAVFTDVDGTLTTGGKLRPSTYRALAALAEAGLPVIVVTGRPAGWGEPLGRLWPVAAVITENGGVTFLPRPGGGGWRTRYAVSRATLAATRRRMFAAAAAVARRFPGARLSSDSVWRAVDLAIDWNEEARLPEATAIAIERFLRARGFRAVRSSVHVNFWPGRFDKLTACRAAAAALLGPGAGRDLSRYLYVGDALNDEPLFRAFPRSVGVANVRAVWDELRHKPAHVTRRAYGAGFEEVARLVLAQARG